MPFEFFTSLLRQATVSGYKSTVITELRWFATVLIAGLVAAFQVNAPPWITIPLFVVLLLVCCVYLCTFVYFVRKNPDFLRSEKFALSKLAIEKSVKGDTITGFIDPGDERRGLQPPKEPKDE